jgi:hypothetical protein
MRVLFAFSRGTGILPVSDVRVAARRDAEINHRVSETKTR